MSVSKQMAAGLVAGSVVALTSGAAMAENKANWSYARVDVGSCDLPSGCNTSHPAVDIARIVDQGFSHNSSASVSDPTRGSASAWVTLDDFPSLPELHAIASGAPDAGGAKSWNPAFVEASVGFKWTGPTMTIPLDTFVGTLKFSNTGTYFGSAIGAVAILDNSIEDPAIGLLWTKDNGMGGFAATCSTPGGESIQTTGAISAKGLHQVALTSELCSTPALRLVHDQDFYFLSRLTTFVFGDEVSDASGTFSVDFKEGTSPDLVRLLRSHVAPVGFVPEPSSWALILLGFGALGAALRSRRRAAAIVA